MEAWCVSSFAVTRARGFAFAAALCVSCPLLTAVDEARAETPSPDLAVGTELMATSNVTLHQAEIAKGSRVSVTKVSRNAGQVETVNVALADGHVVKVTISQVHTYFRVVED